MSKAMKFEKHKSFPVENTFNTAAGWFWKMNVREWAYAQVDVTDEVPMDLKFTGETNNMYVVKEVSASFADPKRVTIRFYAHTPGPAYVYLHDPAVSDHYASVEKMLMQVEVTTRSANKDEETSLTKLEGTTFAVNAPDTKSYEMGSAPTSRASNPLNLFDAVPNGANHVVIASHGIEYGGNICMFPGGSTNQGMRLGNDNVTEVFAKLNGKVAPKQCVVWLGGCNIGMNNKFCQDAANASGCPVIAASLWLAKTKFKKDYVDILDKHASPKIFVPNAREPAKHADFCMKQENYKFVVPV